MSLMRRPLNGTVFPHTASILPHLQQTMYEQAPMCRGEEENAIWFEAILHVV